MIPDSTRILKPLRSCPILQKEKIAGKHQLQLAGIARRFCQLAVLACCLLPTLCFAQEPPPGALWARNMGQSGLRRFFSTGADLGELINRQVSYQGARRTELVRKTARPDTQETENNFATGMEGYVAQWDSLYRIKSATAKPWYLRGLARSAKRLEADKVHSRNDRYDLGLVLATSTRSYLGMGLAIEETRATLKNTSGESRLSAAGPRVDGGVMLNDVVALGFRLEDLHFTGDNSVTINSPAGPNLVQRDFDYRRRYLQLEGILRLTPAHIQWLPQGWQLGGMLATHWLQQEYENSLDSLGRVVNEPFGKQEHLGVVRAGFFISGAMGVSRSWSPYLETLVDHEITNMDSPFTSRNSYILRSGLARTLGPGKRLSLEWQHSNNSNKTRDRDNVILLMVMDF